MADNHANDAEKVRARAFSASNALSNASASAASSTEVFPIQFPLDFPLKMMGRNAPDFAPTIAHIVRKHAPDFDASTLTTRVSAKGNYVALTCTIHATSRAQLDALYRELSAHEMVAYML